MTTETVRVVAGTYEFTARRVRDDVYQYVTSITGQDIDEAREQLGEEHPTMDQVLQLLLDDGLIPTGEHVTSFAHHNDVLMVNAASVPAVIDAPSIKHITFGHTRFVSLTEFVNEVVQDHDQAIHYAQELLDDPFTDVTVNVGTGNPTDVEQYQLVDAALLRSQIALLNA